MLEKLTDMQYRGVIIAVNVVLAVLLLRMRFCYEPELPPKPPQPKGITIADAKQTAARLDRKVEVYAEHLARDAREFGVEPVPSPKSMGDVIPYRQSRVRHLLVPGGNKTSVEFAGLRLTARAAKVPGSARGHMLLDIENLGDLHLAYRVKTRPSKGVQPCTKKRDLGHNAVAVAPHGKETRTECIYQRSWGIEIQRIEVMELSPLQFYYVSSLQPTAIGVDKRVASGHLPANGRKPCKAYLSARNRKALDTGELQWRDLVDFFARHPCKIYEFPGAYRAWTSPDQQPLPVAD